MSYPAIDEMASIESKYIPQQLRFFYAVACQDFMTNSGRSTDTACRNYRPDGFVMRLWRGLNATDVSRYSQRMAAYNARYSPGGYRQSTAVPRELRLASHLAGNN